MPLTVPRASRSEPLYVAVQITLFTRPRLTRKTGHAQPASIKGPPCSN
jgi:hypothetical protein